jgi:hypothetical protein
MVFAVFYRRPIGSEISDIELFAFEEQFKQALPSFLPEPNPSQQPNINSIQIPPGISTEVFSIIRNEWATRIFNPWMKEDNKRKTIVENNKKAAESLNPPSTRREALDLPPYKLDASYWEPPKDNVDEFKKELESTRTLQKEISQSNLQAKSKFIIGEFFDEMHLADKEYKLYRQTRANHYYYFEGYTSDLRHTAYIKYSLFRAEKSNNTTYLFSFNGLQSRIGHDKWEGFLFTDLYDVIQKIYDTNYTYDDIINILNKLNHKYASLIIKNDTTLTFSDDPNAWIKAYDKNTEYPEWRLTLNMLPESNDEGEILVTNGDIKIVHSDLNSVGILTLTIDPEYKIPKCGDIIKLYSGFAPKISGRMKATVLFRGTITKIERTKQGYNITAEDTLGMLKSKSTFAVGKLNVYQALNAIMKTAGVISYVPQETRNKIHSNAKYSELYTNTSYLDATHDIIDKVLVEQGRHIILRDISGVIEVTHVSQLMTGYVISGDDIDDYLFIATLDGNTYNRTIISYTHPAALSLPPKLAETEEYQFTKTYDDLTIEEEDEAIRTGIGEYVANEWNDKRNIFENKKSYQEYINDARNQIRARKGLSSSPIPITTPQIPSTSKIYEEFGLEHVRELINSQVADYGIDGEETDSTTVYWTVDMNTRALLTHGRLLTYVGNQETEELAKKLSETIMKSRFYPSQTLNIRGVPGIEGLIPGNGVTIKFNRVIDGKKQPKKAYVVIKSITHTWGVNGHTMDINTICNLWSDTGKDIKRYHQLGGFALT